MTDVLDRTQTTPPPATEPTRGRPAEPVATRPAPQPRSFRPDIEGLRAIAVVTVVLYHADVLVRGGFIGVDVFFVISGFLITRQLLSSVGTKGIKALPTFYTRRIRRLLPASTVVVVATILAARIWAPALQVHSIVTDGLYTTFYGLNYRLAIEGTQYLHQDDAVSPLQHFWSLGVEEQFYVGWPFLILLAAWLGRRHRRGLLAALLLAVIGVTFYYSVVVTAALGPWAYFSLHTRAWELGIGALVAVGASRLARLPRLVGEWGARLGLVAVLGSAFLYSDSTPYPGSAAALPVLGTALVIACGCGPRRSVERILGEPLMQCLGRISYAWYLWHWPMLVMAPYVLGHPLSVVQRLVVVWLSLAIAIASFFVVENPMRHLGKRTWQGFATGFALSGAVICVVTLVLSNLPAMTGSGAAVTLASAESATPAAVQAVQREIAAGIATTAAPSNLTPTPAQAAHDTPPSSSDGCHADFTVVNQGACVYGDPQGTHTAVLFGDSHMEQWLPGFAAIAAKDHWKIVNWTKAACPPAQLTVFAANLNRTYTECDQWRSRTIDRIAALKPQVVFVGQSENTISSSTSPADVAGATVQTLQQLKARTGARVEFFNDLPVPNSDLPGCVADHLDAVDQCTFPVAKAYTYPDRHAAIAGAVQNAGFPLVETRQWMCTDQRCAAIVGNLLVYRNDTHITATYSRWLAPLLGPVLTGESDSDPTAAMDAAIAAGVRTTAAPRNLTPTPADAAEDLSAAHDTDCHASFTVVKQGACVYGDPQGTHTAVLFGDSHADMWLAAFAEAARSAHWKIVDWTKQSCPPARLTVFAKALNRSYTECDQWRDDTVARINALKPDLVFVSGSENVVGKEVSAQQWSTATLQTMDALRASGARVEFLADVPVPGQNLPSCVASHLQDVTTCTFPVSKAYSFPDRHRLVSSQVAAAGFPVVDPLHWICTDTTCPAIVGNLLVYRDDTHLTATFSRWLSTRVAPLLTSR